MLDIHFIREHADLIRENCRKRRVVLDVDRLLSLDTTRRQIIHQIETVRADRKRSSKSKPSDEQIMRLRGLGEQIKRLELELSTLEPGYKELLLQVPNLTDPKAPEGGEGDFKIVAQHGSVPSFDFQPQDHETIMTGLGILDLERGSKVAASKFYFLKNDGVLLNLALIRYGIDLVSQYGYELVQTPDVARNEILAGIGFTPRGPETQVYSIENTELSLIGTAEITMGGYHAGEILDLSRGPKKYLAISQCFRTEGGAYGKVSKGLFRVHEFTKLEMFIFCRPEESEQMHAELLRIEREICDGLHLVYRVIDIAAADLGAPAYRKYDLEAWMTMKEEGGRRGGWGEITSASNCTDYQARRLNIQYRKPDGSTEFVHTLNGTAIALSRFPVAIIEQYQQGDGSVEVPEVLQKYMGKRVIGSS